MAKPYYSTIFQRARRPVWVDGVGETAFYRESFAKWVGSLRRSLQRDAAAA
jgi:hypothetical protein